MQCTRKPHIPPWGHQPDGDSLGRSDGLDHQTGGQLNMHSASYIALVLYSSHTHTCFAPIALIEIRYWTSRMALAEAYGADAILCQLACIIFFVTSPLKNNVLFVCNSYEFVWLRFVGGWLQCSLLLMVGRIEICVFTGFPGKYNKPFGYSIYSTFYNIIQLKIPSDIYE